MIERIREFNAVLETMNEDTELLGQISSLGDKCVKALRDGGKIVLFGNGGSAADAQHISAELIGRYQKERGPLPAIALTTDTSALTAIANDFDYRFVFSRQIEALVSDKDVVIGISTSGNSENVLSGIEMAKKKGALCVSFVGPSKGLLSPQSDLLISIPSESTAFIQQAHMVVGHVLCEYIEENI
jgi:D-sedoheptulose 7-phosphate isomerase